jgi:hypothetical protein
MIEVLWEQALQRENLELVSMGITPVETEPIDGVESIQGIAYAPPYAPSTSQMEISPIYDYPDYILDQQPTSPLHRFFLRLTKYIKGR